MDQGLVSNGKLTRTPLFVSKAFPIYISSFPHEKSSKKSPSGKYLPSIRLARRKPRLPEHHQRCNDEIFQLISSAYFQRDATGAPSPADPGMSDFFRHSDVSNTRRAEIPKSLIKNRAECQGTRFEEFRDGVNVAGLLSLSRGHSFALVKYCRKTCSAGLF